MKLLFRPLPNESESLSSYLYKLASSNHCSLSWLLDMFKINPTKSLEEINSIYSDKLLESIFNFTEITPDNIIKMTTHKYSYGFWNSNKYYSISSYFEFFIDNLHVKCCPLCLEEGQYHRINWTLRQVNLCIKHNVYLIDFCKECGEFFDIQDVVDGICQCGQDLKRLQPETCMSNDLISYNKLLVEAHENCSSISETVDFVGGNKVSYSDWLRFLFFLYEITSSANRYGYNQVTNGIIDLVQQIRNWPQSLISILDHLNRHVAICRFNKGRYIHFKALGPISCISGQYYELFKIQTIQNILWGYFKEKYKRSFFKYHLREILNYENELYIDDAERIFYIDKEILKGFKSFKINNNGYVKLDDIVDFIKFFIDHGEYEDEEIIGYYQGFNSLYQDLKKLSISVSSLKTLVRNGTIRVKIDPFSYGADMILIQKYKLWGYIVNKVVGVE